MTLNQLFSKQNLKLAYTGLALLALCIFFAAQPFHRATVISSATLLWVFGLFCLPHYIKHKSFDKKELTLYALGFISFLICLISWLNSDYFDGQFKVIEPDARFLLFPLTVIAIRYSGLTFQHLAFALICGAAAYSYITYVSYAASPWRVSGDENPVTYGNGAMLLVVVTSCLAFFEKNKILKLFLILATLGYFYAAYRSGTRGSFVALAPLSLFFFYFMTNKMRIAFLVAIVIGIIAIGQTPLGSRLSKSTDNFISFFEKGEIRNNTGIRMHMWQAAYCLNQEAPWFGVGPHQYKTAIVDENRSCEVKIVSVQAHSFYFNALATIGFLGLAAMLTFFAYLAYFSWSLPLIAKITIPAALLTFLSYAITVDLFFHRYLADKHLTLLAILLALALNHRQNKTAATA
jgi:O-antigen ligase